jgi:hypothetical protein
MSPFVSQVNPWIQYGPYVDLLECTYYNGMAAGSGANSEIGPCEKHPVSGYSWFLARYR